METHSKVYYEWAPSGVVVTDDVPTYYEWAPSGVLVTSTVPFTEAMWWDHSYRNFIWSYASWISLILKAYGHPGMRNFFAKRGWW